MARAVTSEMLASAVITAIGECRENERPLTELQQIDICKMAIMQYHDAMLDVENQLFAEELISHMRHTSRS